MPAESYHEDCCPACGSDQVGGLGHHHNLCPGTGYIEDEFVYRCYGCNLIFGESEQEAPAIPINAGPMTDEQLDQFLAEANPYRSRSREEILERAIDHCEEQRSYLFNDGQLGAGLIYNEAVVQLMAHKLACTLHELGYGLEQV